MKAMEFISNLLLLCISPLRLLDQRQQFKELAIFIIFLQIEPDIIGEI